MKSRSVFWHFFPQVAIYSFIAMIAIAVALVVGYRQSFVKKIEKSLEEKAEMAVQFIQPFIAENDHQGIFNYCQALSRKDLRLTVILSDGKVICDSEKDAREMENHRDRPEIDEAFQGVMGIARRYSFTLKTNFLYIALPVLDKNGEGVPAVVRASVSEEDLEKAISSIYPYTLNVIFFGMLIAILISAWRIRILVSPIQVMKKRTEEIAEGVYGARLELQQSLPEELQKMAQGLNEISETLSRNVEKTAFRKTEQGAILASMSEGVLAIDNEERVTHFNASAVEILELEDNVKKGMTIHELIRLPVLQKFMRRCLEEQKKITREIFLEKGVGNQKTFIVQGDPLVAAEGKVTGAVFVLSDITELRRLEQHRKEFVSNVSHELRTPLTSIRGFAETLMSPQITIEEGNKFAEIISRQSQRLGSLVEDLLSLSKIESDVESGEIVLEETPLAKVVSSAVGLCEARAKSLGLEITTNIESDVSVPGNATLLEQAMVNLIDNALKYSNGSKSVEIFVREDEGRALVEVQDHGIGISSENISRLFERFYRVDAGRSRDLGGTGLGLAIVKHIVQAHRGEVSVKSEIGHGSRFTMNLPKTNRDLT